MANNSQGIYTQLPQSISDSDSETEANDVKEVKNISTPRNLIQNGCNGFNLPTHVVKHPNSFLALSRKRKVAFILSCLLCIFVVVAFLWFLPCSHRICPSHIGSWKIEHEGIEFQGRINVIPSAFRRSSVNLALLARKSCNLKNDADLSSGALALKTANGEIEWFVPEMSLPSELNCDLIDANDDGVPDCLLLTKEQGLQSIDALTGAVQWYAHNTKMILNNLDFPLLLSDLNKDRVGELLSIVDWNQQHNKIIVICGKTGRLLTSLVLHKCDQIEDLKYDEKLVLFNCKNASHHNYYKISIGDLGKKIVNGTYPVQATKVQYQATSLETNRYVLNGRQVTVVNKGECPDCSADVELLDVKGEKPIRLMGWNGLRTYAMKPISYKFTPTKENSEIVRSHLNGFIMKIWHWPDENLIGNYTTIQRSNVTEKVVLISFADAELKVINVSFVQITQLCFPKTFECQPALANRNESILVADLDLDGAQELINYSTTYKCETADEKSCTLVSKMEVIQLEAEMMKLFAKK